MLQTMKMTMMMMITMIMMTMMMIMLIMMTGMRKMMIMRISRKHKHLYDDMLLGPTFFISCHLTALFSENFQIFGKTSDFWKIIRFLEFFSIFGKISDFWNNFIFLGDNNSNKHRKNCECCPVSQLIVR